jgi:hypothetical protein
MSVEVVVVVVNVEAVDVVAVVVVVSVEAVDAVVVVSEIEGDVDGGTIKLNVEPEFFVAVT